MAKKKKTSYEQWAKQNNSAWANTKDVVVTSGRAMREVFRESAQKARQELYSAPGFNPYQDYNTALWYGQDLKRLNDSLKGQNLFVNAVKSGSANPLGAYRQQNAIQSALRNYNDMMSQVNGEADFNEKYAYPLKYQGLQNAAGVTARLQGMQRNIAALRQSGDKKKADALQAEYDWLNQRQYDYWRPEDFDAKIKSLTGLADQANASSRTHGNYIQTSTGLQRQTTPGTMYDMPNSAEKLEAADLEREKRLRAQIGQLKETKEQYAYRDVFSNLSAEDRSRVSDAAKTIARYGGWDYVRRENLSSYNNALKSLKKAGYSQDEADAIIRYATLDRTAQNRAEMLKSVSDWTDQNAVTKAIGSIASIPMSIEGGVGYLGMLADKFTSIGQTDPFTGDSFRVDTNAAATAISDLSQALRGAASKDMSGLGSLVYNATMSFADSLLAMSTGQWAGEAALGLSAATQATKDAYARGATDTQALVMGGMAGLAESLFEHISIDKLRIMRTSNAAARKTIKEFALDWVKQSFTEASEEGATDIANLISDAIIMGDKSELNTMIRQYKDSGMSESEATVQAWKEWGKQVFEDMAAGFLSGGMGTVTNTGIGTFQRNAGYVSEGRKILDAGNASALKELGAALPEGSYGRGLAENVNAEGTNRKTARQLGAIASEVNQNTLRQGVQSRLEQLGAENASETATAIMRELNGQTTTKAQEQLLKSTAAQRVLTEFRSAADGSTSYTNEWAYDALYENAERGRTLRTNDEAVKEVAEFAKDYGRHEEAVNKLFKLQSDMPVDSFKTGFDAAYTMGKNGVDMEQAMTATATQRMSETQRALAWEIGRSAANNTTTEEGVNVNGEEGSVSLSGGGERYDGARAEESVGELAEGAEPSKGNGQVLSRSAKDSGAADLKYEVNPVSTADFGIAGGTQNKSLYRVSENQKLTPAVQAAVDTAKANGRNIVLFGGGNLEVRDGDAIASVRGMYDPNTNTMYVRVDHEKYTAEQIAKHENGHGLIAEGKITVKEVQDYMKRTMDEEAVEQALADYADAYDGIDISDEELWEEIVCDALGGMNIFEGIDVFSEQAERAEQRGEAIRNAAAEMQNGRAPPANVSEETQEILNSVGVQLDEGNDSASPSSFSRETWNESEYVQNREQAAQELSKALGISIAKAKKYISDVNGIAKMIADDRARLDYESSPGRSSFVGNTEYGGSIDFSTVCKKRRLYTGTIEAIQRAFPDRALTADELLKIRSYMAERGYEVNCGFCYVEGSRAKMGKYTKQFLDEYRQSGAEYVPTMAEMNTATGQEQIRREHPEVYDAYVKFMNKLAQRKPKLFQLATAYKGEILQKFKRGESVEEKNRNGGLRLQSFSDFEIIHLIDTMQVIMDMSRVGLAGQAYTKVLDFAWAFGRTGLKINLSLVAKGVDENGKLVYDDVEGMDHNEAKKLRDAYSKNVGTILVVFDDAQLKAAMADDFVDFIIPFHRSQWSKKDYAKMGLAPTTKDYTSKQNERYIKPVYGTKKDGSPKKLRAENFMPNTYWDFNKSGKENAEEYLRMCAEANKRPKFANLLVDNKDGSFSLQPDGSTDGYWKLLIDFKMYDNNGKGSPQMPVRPDFNMSQARRMLNEYTGGHQSFPVAQDVVDHFKEELGGKKQSFSRDLSALDSDYMAAVESGDMEKAQKMVDEAARKAGYDSPKLYHGTNAFGFTEIDAKKSNDRISFFATDSVETAGTYSGTSAAREIGAGGDSSLGIYQMYANTDGMLVLDADGEESGHIALGEIESDYNDRSSAKSWRTHATAKQIAKHAKQSGYTGVIIRNVIDSATPESRKTLPPSDVYAFFNPQSQVKSADPVTYDDDGNIIPLSERFNPENADIRFSRDLENLDELRRENDRLRKRLDAAKQQTRRTTEPTLREGDVRKAARGLLKEMDSTLKVDDIADDMKALGEYMMRGEGKRERAPSWEEVKRRASEIAERIVDNASALSEASDVELYNGLRNYLRTTKLTLAEADRADMQDGYAEFVKRNFNRIKLGNDGLPVDSAYQELQEMYGEGMFPTDITHPADQLMHIEDVLNGLRPVYENPHSYHRQEAVAWAANAVIDTLLSEDVRQTAPTFADKAEARHAADVAKERGKADARVAAERERAEKRRAEYMKRSRAAMERLREQRDRKIEKLKQSFRESKVRDRERREESAAKAKYIKRVRDKAMKLGDWLLKNSDKEHIPEPLKNGVAEFLASINPLSEKTLKGDTAKKDARFIKRMEAVQELLQKKKQSQDGEDVETFGGYLDLPEGYMEMFDNYLKNAREILDGTDVDTSTPLAYMNSEQLRDLDFLISTLMHSIRQMNTLTENGRFHTAIEAAHNTWDSLRGIAEYSLKRDSVKRFLQWDNTTPFYAFRRFGEGGRAVFEGLQEGWDKFAFNVSDVLDFSKKAYTDAEVKAWSEKVNAFTLENGSKIRMTTAQIMSLYELINRDQALGHINGGGIRIADIEQGKDKVQQSEHYHFTMDDISKIVGTLTERQRNVADSLQKYMQEQGGKWGNEVSMKRFGYEAFGEEHYFPIATEGNRNTDDPEAKANDLYRLLNMSATKSLTPHANNALVVSDIFDVFADHMSDMAKYNALALPILDVLKWKNYREKVPAGDDSSNFTEYSTDREIRRAYGKGAGSWLMAFLKDMNGAQESSGRGEGWARKMISNYKVAAVAANLRVALLQPTAYVRAAYVLNPKYLAASAAVSAVSLRRSAQECEKHSGIARWKGLGFYDTNISRGIREQIHDGGGVKDKIQEKSMIFAELGDKLTWGVIWNACKLEQKAKGLIGEKLMEATAKRFREVVYATQVVDSTMTRSHTMRGKSLYSGMATAFMAEPTLSYNMVLDAYMDYDADKRRTDRSTAWRKNGGKIAEAIGVYCMSATAAAIVESLADAWRDDDEYETYLQKFLEAMFGGELTLKGILSGNLVNNLNIFAKLPLAKDLFSRLQGFGTERIDTAAFDDLVKAGEILYEKYGLATGKLDKPTKTTYYGNMTTYGAAYQALKALSRLTGLPVSNLSREVTGLWNNTVGRFTPSKKITTYEPAEKAQLKKAVTEGWLSEKEAIKLLVKKGIADDEDDAYFTIRKWKTDDGKMQKLTDLLASGDKKGFKKEMKNLLDHGVDEKEATGAARDKVRDLYLGHDSNGNPTGKARLSKKDAVSALQEYANMSKDDATQAVMKWTCEVVNGFKYDDIKDQYLEGNLSLERASEMRELYGGKALDDEQLRDWKFEKEVGFSYNDIGDKLIDGEISERQAREYWTDYGGLNEKTVDNKVAAALFSKDHPDVDQDLVTVTRIKIYEQYAPNMDAQDFMEYASEIAKTENFPGIKMSDGKTKPYSVMDQIAAYINDLPITKEQKVALFLTYTNGKTTNVGRYNWS